MGITRTLLRPAAYLAGLHAGRQAKAFLAAHRQTPHVQQRLLARLLRCHADTDFGRDHGFARIRTYDDFAAAVPVGSYETHRPYIDRVLHGRCQALFPPGVPVLMFSLTSGTTGRCKYIPVTPRFAAEMRRGWNIFGLLMLNDHPEAWLRPILQISSAIREADSPTGLPCGAISGLLARQQKRIVRRMYVVPQAVTALADPLVKYYTILRCGIGRDVSFITTANPSSTIRLIETGQAHAERLVRDVADGTCRPPGQLDPSVGRALRFRPRRDLAARIDAGIRRDAALLPRHFWNVAMLANWTGGTLTLYLPRLRELFDGAPVRDIGLLASEGRFSIPLADETSAGVAEITANFLEFLPDETPAGDAGACVRAHEVEVGKQYSLVLSNWAGLWRYNIDDRVRVVDRYGLSPVFEFLSRGPHTASITGEKITEHQVVEAMRIASGRLGLAVRLFVVQGRFAATPYYELRLELTGPEPAEALAAEFDKALGQLNIEYAAKRRSGRLQAVRAVPLPPGTLQEAQAEAIRRRHGRSEQYKHQYLLPEVVPEG